MANVPVAPDNQRTRVRIQNYSDVNPVALRRVLTDPNLASNATLNQTFATFLLVFDPETQLFKLPEDLTNPPKVSNEPGKSRIWNDFTFQEIGKGDEFLTMESIVEKDPDNPQAMASGIAPLHPYLSIEKASRVNQWVVERAEIETDDEPEHEAESEPEPEPGMVPQPDVPEPDVPEPGSLELDVPQFDVPFEPPLAPPTKKTPGIRTRKAATGAKAPEAAPTPELVNPSSPVPGKRITTPRKRWRMQYDSGAEDSQVELPDRTRRYPSDSLLDLISNSPPGSATVARPQSQSGAIFDPTKYGLAKNPQHSNKNPWDSSASLKSSSGNGENLLTTTPQKKPRSSDLIDMFTTVTSDKPFAHPLMSFDQPALIPQKSGDSGKANSEIPITPTLQSPVLDPKDSFHDLLGLDFEKESTASAPSSAVERIPSPIDTNGDDLSWQEEKLRKLRRSILSKKRDAVIPSSGDSGTVTQIGRAHV